MTHEPFNAAMACRVPQDAQGNMDSGYAIPAAMGQMELPDLAKQDAIGRPSGACGPVAPSIISPCRDAHDVAQNANREHLALILDEAEFHFGGSEKIRSVS